jgi:hypothetical protein
MLKETHARCSRIRLRNRQKALYIRGVRSTITQCSLDNAGVNMRLPALNQPAGSAAGDAPARTHPRCCTSAPCAVHQRLDGLANDRQNSAGPLTSSRLLPHE